MHASAHTHIHTRMHARTHAHICTKVYTFFITTLVWALSKRDLKNRSTFCNQTWHSGVSSWGGVPCKRIWLLFFFSWTTGQINLNLSFWFDLFNMLRRTCLEKGCSFELKGSDLFWPWQWSFWCVQVTFSDLCLMIICLPYIYLPVQGGCNHFDL